ncbi:hypothetical protein WI26_09405 [Burkholderia diffusa]|nr:hypothetical protein WI26_09405 [Burkholderia diffusa]
MKRAATNAPPVCRVVRAGSSLPRARVAGIRVSLARPRTDDGIAGPAFVDIECRCVARLRDARLIARHLSAASFCP